jgi:hypothetical protein
MYGSWSIYLNGNVGVKNWDTWSRITSMGLGLKNVIFKFVCENSIFPPSIANMAMIFWELNSCKLMESKIENNGAETWILNLKYF